MYKISGEDMMKMARHLARKYYSGYILEYDEIVSECLVGIMRAAKLYDEGKGVTFATYAYASARRTVAMYLKKERRWWERTQLDGGDIQADTFVDYGELDTEKYAVEDMRARVMENITGKKAREIAAELLKGKEQRDICEEFGISRQYVSRIFVKIRDTARELYTYENGVLERK